MPGLAMPTALALRLHLVHVAERDLLRACLWSLAKYARKMQELRRICIFHCLKPTVTKSDLRPELWPLFDGSRRRFL